MSYLQHLFNQPKAPSVQTHLSVESLIRSVSPLQESSQTAKKETVKEPQINEIENVKEFAEISRIIRRTNYTKI